MPRKFVQTLTVANGLIQSGASDFILASDLPAFTWSSITGTPTTLGGYGITDAQPLDSTLTALAAFNTNGLVTQTAADTFTGRTLTGTASRVAVTNGDGVAGNPTVDIDAAYAGQASIVTVGTITSGMWQSNVIDSTYGGTGVNNAGRTLTISSQNAHLSFSSSWTLSVTADATVSGTNTGDQTITLTGAVTGSGTSSFATTIATPGTLTVASTNSTATAHTHAVTSSSAPGAAASILATDASGIIGSTGTRIVKGWFIDLTVTNAIAGSITGNAATVTHATLTTALTVNGGTLTLTANAANTSVLTIGAGAVSVSGSNTGDQTITLTGDVTGSGTSSFVTTLKNTGTAGTYNSVTTDAAGRVTAGANPSDGGFLEMVNTTLTSVPIDLLVCGRATLTTGTPVADATAQTSVFWTPYKGNRIVLFDGTRDIPVTFSEQTFKLTDSAQTGGTITGTTITGLTDTSKLFVGMKLSASTGTGTLAANTTIATIAGGTSITVNNAASVNGTLTNLVFKMPLNSNIDVFGVYSAGLVLRPGTLWTNQTTRADTVAIANDGRWFNTSVVRNTQNNSIAANAGLLLYTVATNGTDGQTDDSPGSGATAASRLLLNWYNRVSRSITMCPGYVDDNTATSYTTASTTFVAANSGTGATINFLSSGEDAFSVDAFTNTTNNGAGSNFIGIGIDSTSTAVAAGVVTPGTTLTNAGSNWSAVASVGLHSINLLVCVSANTGTFFADTTRRGGASDPTVTGIRGTIFA